MEYDSMNKLEPSLSKDSCQLNQLAVLNSKASSVCSDRINKSKLPTSEDVGKCDLFEPDNSKTFIEGAETLNFINNIDESQSSPSKDSCQLNQLTVLNSKPSSVHSDCTNKPGLSTSEDVSKSDLLEPDNNKTSFIEGAETLNFINMEESELSSSKDPCQFNLSAVDSFNQCDNDFISSVDIVNETELLCLQESSHLTQSVTDHRRKEGFVNMPTIISELNNRQNESETASLKNMPVLVRERLGINARDSYGNADMATVGELKQAQEKDCQTDKLIMNSNDYFTTVENYLLDERNFCNTSYSTNSKNASEALKTVEKPIDERSCQTDELMMGSNEYFMTAGNYILHEDNQNNVLCSANSNNALQINENEPYHSTLDNILSQISLGENFQMSQGLPENEDANCMIPPSQDISYFLSNRAGGLHSNKAIHQNLQPSEADENSNFHLDEINITAVRKQKIPDKIHNAISRRLQSSDTDVTEILPVVSCGNKNQSKNELHLGRRILNSKTETLETNTGIHLRRPLFVKKCNHSVNHSTPMEARKKSYFVEHFQHIPPTSGVSSEDASHFSCELSTTDCDPERVPGHDKNSSSCKRKLPFDKRKRCAKKSPFKSKNNSKAKNSTIINHYNISKTPLTSIDDIIADINKFETNIRASHSCLQNNTYHSLNQNETSKAKNSCSLAEAEYSCCKENVCNECTNISPSVSNAADNLNQMIHSHNRLINVYNVVYVGSNMCKDASVSSDLTTEGNRDTSSDRSSSKKNNLSYSSVENNANVSDLTSEAEENIFLMKSNANMPNIADVMSSTVHLENNISNPANFIFNQNQLNGTTNKDNPKIVPRRSLSRGAARRTKCSSKPDNVLLNNVVTKKLIFQQNSLNSNCQEHNRANSSSAEDIVVHPASQFRVNLGERLPENEISSFQKVENALSNQRERAACLNSPTPPRQSANKFLDGIPITAGPRKSYSKQSEISHGISNESLVETGVNNRNILTNAKIGKSIMPNAETIEEAGGNNVKCNSNSQKDCPRISTDGFTTDGSDFHSPDSSDSNSSFESTHSKKSKKSSLQNLPPSVGCGREASILKPSKFHIYSCDNDSDTSSDDFVSVRKRPAPEIEARKSSCKRKVPVSKRRKVTLFNENKQYFLRSRASMSAPKKLTDEIL